MKSYKFSLVFLFLISISMTSWVNCWWGVYSNPEDGFFKEDEGVVSSSHETQQQHHEEDGDEDRIDLDGMIVYLRADDDRLVRFNIDSEEAEHRQYEACSRDVERVMDLLIGAAGGVGGGGQQQQQGGRTTTGGANYNNKVKAVRILTMCALQNPFFRNKIGRYRNGKVLDEIISMLGSGSSHQMKRVVAGRGGDNEGQDLVTGASTEALGAAVAAEAIWILSFNNQYNHGYFVENGAIEKLSNIIKDEPSRIPSSATRIMSENKNEIKGSSGNSSILLATMWSAAALQNLAASYCKTDSGHCWWLFDHDARLPKEGGLHLHPESPLFIDGSTAASRISQDEDLMVRVKDNVCRGSISTARGGNSNSSSGVILLPSLATIHDTDDDQEDQLSSKITTWSMAGLLKNLALYQASKQAAMDVASCLCELTGSQDWLEASKASDALYRLGRDPDDCHHSSHDRDL